MAKNKHKFIFYKEHTISENTVGVHVDYINKFGYCYNYVEYYCSECGLIKRKYFDIDRNKKTFIACRFLRLKFQKFRGNYYESLTNPPGCDLEIIRDILC